jgi:hypothetical protein
MLPESLKLHAANSVEHGEEQFLLARSIEYAGTGQHQGRGMG